MHEFRDRDGNIYRLTDGQMAEVERQKAFATQHLASTMRQTLRPVGYSMGCKVASEAPCTLCAEKNPHEHK